MEWRKGAFLFSDEAEIDADTVYDYLQTTYWSPNRSREVVCGILRHSFWFSLWREEQMVGFVRVISDYSSLAWIADMFVDAPHRGKGIGGWMLDCLMEHPQLMGCQFVLQTKDAHTFYEKRGFEQRETLMSTSVPYLIK